MAGMNHTEQLLTFVQAEEKIIVGAVIEFFELYQNACPNIKLPRLVLGVGSSADIAGAALEFLA